MTSHQLDGGEEREEVGLLRSIACCTPRTFNAGNDDLPRSDDGRGRDITYDQPQRVAQPSFDSSRIRPATSRSASTHFSQWYDAGRAGVSKARRPWTSHSQTKGRPKIGAPTDFRRISDMPRRRQEFRPLELSIYMPGRALSPLPDFTLDQWNLQTGLQKPAPALVTDMELPRNLVHSYTDSVISTGSYSVRRKPLSIVGDADGHRRYDSYASANTSILDEGSVPGIIDHILQDHPTEPSSAMIQSLPVAQQVDSRYGRPRTSSSMANEIGSMSPQRPRSRSSTQSSSSRKQSLRRTKAEDVDEAIRELNTIVEERRLDAVRAASRNHTPRSSLRVTAGSSLKSFKYDGEVSPALPSPHVPAIVPTMKVHARSETLSDIGSAFSTPLVGKGVPTPPLPAMTLSQESLQQYRPKLALLPVQTSRSVTALSPVSQPSQVSARTKISSWLRKSLTASLVTPIEENGPDYMSESYQVHEREKSVSPFYRCEEMQDYDAETSTSTLSTFAPSPLEAPRSGHSSFSMAATTIGTALTSMTSPTLMEHERRPSATKLPLMPQVEKRTTKAAHTARARGLSVGTVTGVPPPPAYEEFDSNPSNHASPVSPADSRIVGLAF